MRRSQFGRRTIGRFSGRLLIPACLVAGHLLHGSDADTGDAPKRSPWFHHVTAPAVLESGTGAALCRWIRDSLAEGAVKTPVPEIPNDRSGPSVVCVSLPAESAGPAVVRSGHGQSLRSAAKDALLRCLVERGPAAGVAVRLDVVQHSWQHPGFQIRQTEVPAPGMCGVAFSPASGLAFLPAELIAVDALNAERRLVPERIELLLARRDRWGDLGRWNILGNYTEPQPACFFECQSFFLDRTGPAYVFRGHRMVQPLTPARVARRLRLGAAFLARALNDNPAALNLRDTAKTDPPSQPLVLEDWIGCAVALFEYAAQEGDERARTVALRLLDRIRKAEVRPSALSKDSMCLSDDGSIRLGTNALALLAFLSADDEQADKDARRLGRYVADQLTTDHHFVVRRDAISGAPIAATSPVASAQAVLALVRLYEQTAESRYRSIAIRAMDTLLEDEVTHADMADLPRSPWLVEALNAAYTHQRRRTYSRAAERLALASVARQTLDPHAPDEWGGLAGSPSATEAALQVQLLAEGAEVLKSARRLHVHEDLLAAQHGYLMFQLQAQLDAAATFFLEKSESVLGAFRDDAVVVRFRPVDQWVQLRALLAFRRQFPAVYPERGESEAYPLTASQKRTLLDAYRAVATFPRALPED